jgi:hypothetical protein
MEELKKVMRDLLNLLWVNSPASPQIVIEADNDFPMIWATWLVNGEWIDVEVDRDGWWINSHPTKLTTREGPLGELPSWESLQEYRDKIELMGTHVVMRAPERLDILL